MAYGAAVTVVFSCCTFVCVWKTGGVTIGYYSVCLFSIVVAHQRTTGKQFSLTNPMITDEIDSNLSPISSPITTTKCCSNYDYNSVMGQCPGPVSVIYTYGTIITPCRVSSSMLLLLDSSYVISWLHSVLFPLSNYKVSLLSFKLLLSLLLLSLLFLALCTGLSHTFVLSKGASHTPWKKDP